MSKQTILPEQDRLLSRNEVSARWSVSTETIKRRQQDGTLKPVYLEGNRLVRYRLSDIISLEQPAEAKGGNS